MNDTVEIPDLSTINTYGLDLSKAPDKRIIDIPALRELARKAYEAKVAKAVPALVKALDEARWKLCETASIAVSIGELDEAEFAIIASHLIRAGWVKP